MVGLSLLVLIATTREIVVAVLIATENGTATMTVRGRGIERGRAIVIEEETGIAPTPGTVIATRTGRGAIAIVIERGRGIATRIVALPLPSSKRKASEGSSLSPPPSLPLPPYFFPPFHLMSLSDGGFRPSRSLMDKPQKMEAPKRIDLTGADEEEAKGFDRYLPPLPPPPPPSLYPPSPPFPPLLPFTYDGQRFLRCRRGRSPG